jgi:glycosyltransferase involved in cell wall biosynthesis
VFHVVGSKPPPEILALAAPDVVVHGFVEDIGPLLDKMRVSVAPLRYGAGVKGKVGTALAAGLPTVATPIAAEGMGLVDGRNVLIAGEAPKLAAAITRLHTDEALWTRIGAEGLRHAESSWGPGASYTALRGIVEHLGLRCDAPPDHITLYTPAMHGGGNRIA